MARQHRSTPSTTPLTDAELARRMKSGASRKLEDRLLAAGWDSHSVGETAGSSPQGSPAGDASASDLP